MADKPKSIFESMPEKALALFQSLFSDSIQNKALACRWSACAGRGDDEAGMAAALWAIPRPACCSAAR